jgi:hypothetical protein
MQTALLGLHSLWRWVVLIAIIVTLVRGIIGWVRGGAWTTLDDQLRLLTVTAIDIQVLLGILVWLVSKGWNLGAFLGFVHPVIMIIALVAAHIGAARAKRERTPTAKYRALTIGLIVTIVLVTAAIPSAAWSKIWA